MRALEHGAAPFLESLREAFPRFYFLGDQEVLRAVSAGSLANMIDPLLLARCFPGVAGLSLQVGNGGAGAGGAASGAAGGSVMGRLGLRTSRRSDPNIDLVQRIVGVVAPCGETLVLSTPVQTSGRTAEAWLGELETQVRTCSSSIISVFFWLLLGPSPHNSVSVSQLGSVASVLGKKKVFSPPTSLLMGSS